MGQILYERPRERLRARGAQSLTLTELLQIIIGSGTRKVSGARLAKRAARLFVAGQPTFEELLAIAGLGEAKVCQLLAAYEIGKRLTIQPAEKLSSIPSSFEEVSLASKQLIQYITYDGAGVQLQSRRMPLRSTEHYTLVVRRIFAAALGDGAASVAIGIGWRDQQLQPSLVELNISKAAKEIADLMQIQLREILLLSAAGNYRLTGGLRE